MTIVIGSMMQETNSFSPVPTTLEVFSNNYLYYGDEVLTMLTGTRTEIGGFLHVLQQTEKIVQPTIATKSIAGGKVTEDAYQHFKKEFLTRISKMQDIEGVLLALHGAMLTEQCDDPEGDLLSAIRNVVGTEIPIAITLDPHAHMTEQMLNHADVIVGYKTFPHVDHFETGIKAAELLLQTLSNQLNPVMEMKKISMLTSPEAQDDSEGPIKEIIDYCRELEEAQDVEVVSFFPVQPWLDIPNTGTVALVIANANKSIAKSIADKVLEKAWSIRDTFIPKRLEPKEAIEFVKNNPILNKPVVISESSDSTLAGAPGDCAFLLKALLENQFQDTAYVTIVDPEAVEEVYGYSEGAEVKLFVGHKLDKRWGNPVEITGLLHHKSEGKFLLQQTNVMENMGRTAVIKVGNIYVVICEISFSHLDPNSYSALGLEPQKAKIIGVKSTLHFRAFYRDIASKIILLNTLGVSNGDFGNFTWEQLTRPCWPLDSLE